MNGQKHEWKWVNHKDEWQDKGRLQLCPNLGNYSHQLHSKVLGYRKTPASHFHRAARFGVLEKKGHTDLRSIDINYSQGINPTLISLLIIWSRVAWRRMLPDATSGLPPLHNKKKQLPTMLLRKFLQSWKCRMSMSNLKETHERWSAIHIVPIYPALLCLKKLREKQGKKTGDPLSVHFEGMESRSVQVAFRAHILILAGGE